MGLGQDGDQWRALVNTAMNFVLHKRWEISRLVELLLAFQGLCSTKSVSSLDR
jgi:hypothetical protein